MGDLEGFRYSGLIERYRDRLPVDKDTKIISLSEGDTPLIRLDNLMTVSYTHLTLPTKA